MPKYVVARADEIPPGGRKIVQVGDLSVGVFNLGGEYFALRNRCPHQGGPLCEGRLAGYVVSPKPGEYEYVRDGEILRCPWHGWEFDIRTGQSYCDPRRLRTRAYEVHVEPGATIVAEAEAETPAEGRVKGPYVAESYPVEAEGEYVVVEIQG